MAQRLLLAGLAVLLAAGCGGSGSAKEAAKPEQRSAEAQKALDEADDKSAPPDDGKAIEEQLYWRGAGLAAGDGVAMAQAAGGRQRARDKLAARRADRMGAEDITVEAADVEIDGDRAKVNAAMSYRINGMSRPFVTLRKVELRKRDDKWLVTRDSPRHEPLPWEVDAFKVTRARNVVLLTARGLDPGPMRAGLVRAYREIRRDLPARDLPRSVLVIGARDEKQTEELAGPIANGVVALANVRAVFGPRPARKVTRVYAQRMIVVGSAWNRMGPEERHATLVHEMTHTALNADTSGRTPPWLVEGTAMHVAGENRAQEALARAAGLAPVKRLSELCKPASIFTLNGREQGAAYASASAAAEAIVARHGTEGLFELYDAFNEPRYRARSCNEMTDLIMRKTLGMPLAELEAAVTGG